MAQAEIIRKYEMKKNGGFMKITVLNGSPKGDLSITMQYVKFIEKKFPDHEYEYINVSQRINKIEDDPDLFGDISARIASSDLIVWSVPLYFCLVPSQYKRFIELIWERSSENVRPGVSSMKIGVSLSFPAAVANLDQSLPSICPAICQRIRSPA